MNKTKSRRRPVQLTREQLGQLQKDRELIAQELPKLVAKQQRLRESAAEPTHSGALRRAIHASNILLHNLADRAGTDMKTLDAFLIGDRPLTSDVIDKLTRILNLKLAPANGKPKQRRAKAG